MWIHMGPNVALCGPLGSKGTIVARTRTPIFGNQKLFAGFYNSKMTLKISCMAPNVVFFLVFTIPKNPRSFDETPEALKLDKI